MPLSRSQKAKMRELEQIAALVHLDIANIREEPDSDVRNVLLGLAKDRLVRSGILSAYLLIDELLTGIMCQRFFDPKKTSFELWRTKRFREFNYYIVEEMPLFRKLAIVMAIKPLPKQIAETIRLTNTLRNAIAQEHARCHVQGQGRVHTRRTEAISR